MKIIIDENVSHGVALALREAGYDVVAIAESATTGIIDEDIFRRVVGTSSVLITRDYHFTNPLRFPADKTKGIIYIRRGNLSAFDEITIVRRFLSIHPHSDYTGKLVTLYKDSAKIR